MIQYPNRRARAGPHRPAEVHEAGDARCAHARVFDATQREARIAHELRDVTVDMAAIKEGFPERIQSILPFRDGRFGMTTVLEEQELPAGLEYPSHFRQCRPHVRNATERERRNDAVETCGVESQGFSADLMMLDRDPEPLHAPVRDRRHAGIRVDRHDLRDGTGVMGQVQPSAEAEFKDAPLRGRKRSRA